VSEISLFLTAYLREICLQVIGCCAILILSREKCRLFLWGLLLGRISSDSVQSSCWPKVINRAQTWWHL